MSMFLGCISRMHIFKFDLKVFDAVWRKENKARTARCLLYLNCMSLPSQESKETNWKQSDMARFFVIGSCHVPATFIHWCTIAIWLCGFGIDCNQTLSFGFQIAVCACVECGPFSLLQSQANEKLNEWKQIWNKFLHIFAHFCILISDKWNRHIFAHFYNICRLLSANVAMVDAILCSWKWNRSTEMHQETSFIIKESK